MKKKILKNINKAISTTTPKVTVSKTVTKEYSFFNDVYDVVRQIPKGKVTSYGAIAAYLGTRLSARMVGWAMNAAHTAQQKVPAQRVVNRNGMLTGKHHFSTPTLMEELLKKDGVVVKNDTVQNFTGHFWDPAQALGL
jgi:methylated-DNA-protein-cysteine methyltransferase-like protein